MIAVIDKDDVIEKILSRPGLWIEDARGLPPEIKYIEYEKVMREVFDDGCTVD